MRTAVIIGGLVLALTSANHALADEKYTLEDLRALVENEGWSELLEHVEDVRPSQRKAEWKTMLEKAAAGHLSILQTQDKRQEALAASEQILTRFPVLKKSRVFMDKRGEVGLLAYRECFKGGYGGGQCVQDLTRFIDVEPTDTDLAFEAGKVVTGYAKLWRSGPELFVRSMSDASKRKARCTDSDLQYSTLDSLGHPADYPMTKAAMKIAFEHCHAELKDQLMKALYESGSTDGKNLCTGFTAKKAKLSAFQQAYCRDAMAK